MNEQVSLQPLADDNTLTQYVDTRSGTGGILWNAGNGTPAACVPTGMVKLGPDTNTLGNMASTSGYHYGDTELLGFSHTRMSGTGAWDGGVLRVIPTRNAKSFAQLRKHFLFFSHSYESAVPGFYSVTTFDGIKAELTATARVGLHRYTIPGTNPHLVLELTSHFSKGGTTNAVSIAVDTVANRITGSLLLLDSFSGRYSGLENYFVLTSDTQIVSYRFLSKAGESSPSSIAGNDGPTYLDLEFSTTSPINLQVALSHVDGNGALQNLNSEVITPAKTFEQVKQDASALWQTALSRITVEGGRTDLLKNFYQNLYRTFLMPSVYSDFPDGGGSRNYKGFDRATHAASFDYYTELSLWDQFRTLFPLYTLIAPEIQSAVVNSMMAMADQSGRLPRWAGGEGHTDSMLGQPANIIIAESYLKNIPGFDVQHAYAQVLSSATPDVVPGASGKECLTEYVTYGYCPEDLSTDSVSFTLEYSYSDFAVGQLAQKLGKPEAASFQARGKSYRNLWDPQQLAFVPKTTTGQFEKSFNIHSNSYLGLYKADKHYREGTPNQYRWYVPYDVEGLVSLFGEAFIPQLDEFFAKSPQVTQSVYPNSYYWAGNEPDIQAFFEFAAAGRPDLTQKYGRWAASVKYLSTSNALDGNDDGGTLSAWYVLSTIGLFPIAGTTRYILTSPIFPKTTLSLGVPGSSPNLVITASPDPTTNIYVCGATLNGNPLANPWVEHPDIAAGGTIAFTMSPTACAWKGN